MVASRDATGDANFGGSKIEIGFSTLDLAIVGDGGNAQNVACLQAHAPSSAIDIARSHHSFGNPLCFHECANASATR